MKPVIIHADGTDCCHPGQPQSTLRAAGGPTCPAGLPVTHIRFGDNTLPLGEAYVSFKTMAEAWTQAFTPLITAFAEFARQLSDHPAIRAVAAAAAVVEEARAAEARAANPVADAARELAEHRASCPGCQVEHIDIVAYEVAPAPPACAERIRLAARWRRALREAGNQT